MSRDEYEQAEGLPGGAGGDDRGVDWLGDGARAVGDGEGGGLSDGVGLAVVGDLGGSRAVGGELSDDLSHVGSVGVGLGNGSEASGSSSDDETHVDSVDWCCWWAESECVRRSTSSVGGGNE